MRQAVRRRQLAVHEGKRLQHLAAGVGGRLQLSQGQQHLQCDLCPRERAPLSCMHTHP